MKVCIYTVAFGDTYNALAENLAASIRKNGSEFEYEMIAISDKHINGWNTIRQESINKIRSNLICDIPYTFKFAFLEEVVKISNSSNFIYLDSDSICISKLKISNFFNYDLFIPRETKLINLNTSWAGCKTNELINLAEKLGIDKKYIYNCNGGFWSFKKDYYTKLKKQINHFCLNVKENIPEAVDEAVLSLLAGNYYKNNNLPNENAYNNEFAALNTKAVKYETIKTPYVEKEWLGNNIHNIKLASIVHCPNCKSDFSKNKIVKPKLHILTATIRPQQIFRLGQNIIDSRISSYFDIIWAICFDLNDKDVSYDIISYIESLPFKTKIKFIKDHRNKSGGNYAKDMYIKSLDNDEEWIWQYDDDNTIHDKYPKTISDFIYKNPQSNLVVYWQKDRFYPKKIEDLKLGIVDTAMYTFKVKIGKLAEYPYFYGGDGIFLENLIKDNNNSVDIIKEVLCNYNTHAHLNTLGKSDVNIKNAAKKINIKTEYSDLHLLGKKRTIKQIPKNGFSLKFYNKVCPKESITVDVFYDGKITLNNQNNFIWTEAGRDRMTIINDKSKRKVGEIVKQKQSNEYYALLNVSGRTSATAWIGKEI